MKLLIIKSNWLFESDLRLDGKFHLSDGRLARKKISNSPYPIKSIGEVTKDIFYGGRDRRIYVKDPKKGILFMGSADMLKSSFDTLKYISKRHTKNLDSYLLGTGWTLVSRSGTIGNTVFTNEDYRDKAASEHIIRIPPGTDILPGVLYSYLSSKYGYALLTQGTFGAVIQHIEPEFLAELPIPILPDALQQVVHNLMMVAAKLRVESNEIIASLLQKINTHLKDELGNLKKVNISSRSINDIVRFDKRFDAPYNISMGRRIHDKFTSGKYVTLASLSEVFHPMLFGKKQLKGSVSRGNPLYKSSSMMKMKPETDFWLSLNKTESYAKLKVKEGWVLISRTGTVGNVVRITKSMNDVFIDDHMIRVKPKEKFSGLIYIFLKSFYGHKLIDFQKYGSVQEVINSDYIERIPIPQKLLADNILTEFNDNVRDSAAKIDKAIDYENEAIVLIEKEIESWQK